jgi:aspartate beta-hydroxylase/beta-hydroxylase
MTTFKMKIINWFYSLQKTGLTKLNSYFYQYTGGQSRPVFFNIEKTCPELLEFDRNFEAIQQELVSILPQKENIPRYYDVDQLQSYISGGIDTSENGWKTGWKVFMLYLMGLNVAANQQLCPQTTAILKKIPNLYQAFFSILDPGKSIVQHKGPFLGYIRYHLALKVPEDNPPVLNIKDQRYCWEEGKSVLFDDTWSHDVQNNSRDLRVVLIVDILRPMPFVPHMVNQCVSRLFIKNLYGKKIYNNLKKHE